MDYEKAYNDLIKEIKKAHQKEIYGESIGSTKKVLERLLPELAESEDEKIRNELLIDIPKVFPHDKAFKYLAYLEKQKDLKYSEEQMEDIRQYAYNKGIVYAKEKQKEQKPAEWSEEDEKKLENVLECITTYFPSWAYERYFDWLKDLPNRFSIQSKQERSEEDKTIIESACNALEFHGYTKLASILKSLRPQQSSQPNINHTVWHNASEEKPTKLPIIHIWYHGNRVNTVVAHENIDLQEELDDINFQPDDKWAYVEDLLNAHPHWKPSEEQMDHLAYAYTQLKLQKCYAPHVYESLGSLYDDLKKHFSL